MIEIELIKVFILYTVLISDVIFFNEKLFNLHRLLGLGADSDFNYKF